MKRIAPLFILLVFGFVAGCDDDDNGTGNRNTTPQRVVANDTAGTPSLGDANDPIWDNVAPTTVDVSGGGLPKRHVGDQTAAIPPSVDVQAIEDNGFLFLRLRWADPTHDVWPDHWAVENAGPPASFTRNELADEDAAFVLFQDTASGFDFDVWGWRALTTGAAGMGVGFWLRNDSLEFDSTELDSGVAPAIANEQENFIAPQFFSPDTSDFSSPVLMFGETVNWDDSLRSDTVTFGGNDTVVTIEFFEASGWEVGDRLPGWVVDTSFGGSAFSDEQRGSRWDIRTVSTYDSTASTYTVVFRTPMNSNATDDASFNTMDSVQVIIGLFDNQDDFNTASNRRGFSQLFWLIFP